MRAIRGGTATPIERDGLRIKIKRSAGRRNDGGRCRASCAARAAGLQTAAAQRISAAQSGNIKAATGRNADEGTARQSAATTQRQFGTFVDGGRAGVSGRRRQGERSGAGRIADRQGAAAAGQHRTVRHTLSVQINHYVLASRRAETTGVVSLIG